MTRVRFLCLLGLAFVDCHCGPGSGDESGALVPGVPASGAQGNPGCVGGRWRPGSLEIHHIDVGQADATLIVGPTGRSLLVDVGETSWELSTGAQTVGDYVRDILGCARLDYVLITHFHLDHVGYVGRGGLWHLVNVQGFVVGQTLHRDLDGFVGSSSGTLTKWRAYLAAEGIARLHPVSVRPGATRVHLGPGVTFQILATDGAGTMRSGDFSHGRMPPNENDYSVATHLRFGLLDYYLGGDLSGQLAATDFGYAYHDVETHVARLVGDVDVYRANHHGSDHSSNATFIAQVRPEISIISLGNGNGFGHPRQAVIDRLTAAGTVYLTERGEPSTNVRGARVAGHVVLRTETGREYSVNGDAYTASDPVRVDADHDGYFREADPNDGDPHVGPTPNGGCDPVYQVCAADR